MKKFDPIQKREFLLSDIGVRRELAQDVNNDRANGWLTSHANSYLGTAIQCILVGVNEPAVWLLEKAHQWLTAAIDENEVSPFYSELRNEWLADCKWLLYGLHDTENLRQTLRFVENAEGQWTEYDVELLLPHYCDAGEFARACEIFEKHSGRESPSDLRQIKDDGSMAYIICLHRLARGYSRDEVDAAAGCFLKRRVPDLLARGQYGSVARWMKLTYWNGDESREAAWRSVLRCYDFLPGVMRPTDSKY